MGYMRHHAIVVTGYDYKLEAAREKAVECELAVSGIVDSGTNGYRSFMVAPDGSKEGWDASKNGDYGRDTLVKWLTSSDVLFEDRSSPLSWVEVQYGDDEYETKVVRDSDEAARRVLR